MNAEKAQTYAHWLVAYLSCACEEIEIAGSLRRGKAEVKDIEIVVRPVRYINLFAEPLPGKTMLDTRLGELMETEKADWDAGNQKNGEKYKRFLMKDMTDPSVSIAVDLFIADEHNFGNILAIRTGDAVFSRELVTRRTRGGLMPEEMRQDGGYLWRILLPSDVIPNERISCPTEEQFFEALGLPWIAPNDRSAVTVARLRCEALRRLS